MKFEEMKVRVPNFKKICEKIETLTSDLDNALDEKQAYQIIKKYHRINDDYEANCSLVFIHYSLNTADKKIINAQNKIDENSPLVSAKQNEFNKTLLKSKYRPYLENKLGSYYFEMIENALKCFDESIIEDLVLENKLSSSYSMIMASAQIYFKDGIYNLSQMNKFTTSKDREERRLASIAVDSWLGEHEQQIGDIYDQLVKVRDKMAKQLGFENFTKLGYLRLGRTDYDAEMVKGYRKQISESAVPCSQKIFKTIAKRIGLNFNKMESYDFNISFKEGNPKPVGEYDDLIRSAKTMYDSMSNETSVFFNFMLENNLMDLKARAYKQPGGYMCFIPKYNVPFIFANFNGTDGDVNVLTHEVGHAFQAYLSRNISNPYYRSPTLEACEIHSMSMEFFAWPYMDLFFNEAANRYMILHLEDAIKFLPYGITIDEFQHWVYENPNATHMERCTAFREIEKRYLPHKKYNETPTYNHGGFWLKQSHVFGSPFYYIDYTLAQVLALSFLVMMDKDRDKAFKKYVRLCKCGGKYPFITLLEKNHLMNPFIEGNVKKTLNKAYKLLKNLEQ